MTTKPAIFAVLLSAASFVATCARAQAPLRDPAAAPAAQPVNPADEAEARSELAERFFAIAMNIAGGTQASNTALDASSAFLEAAAKLNPLEPRYLRTLAFERERANDVDGAIKTWKRYRAIPAMADDRVAQAEVIELYLSKLQSNDEKVKYIRELLARPTLDDQVKAHIAALAVRLLDQRSRSEALVMLGAARKFYPLPEVTLLELAMLPPDATTVQRFEALLNVVRANPCNAPAIAEIADMLSSAGLSEQALNWYSILIDVHNADGTSAAPSFIVNYLAERYRAGEVTVAADQLDAVLQKFPDDPEFWQLRLTVQRGDDSAQMRRQAEQVFAKRVDDICDAISAARGGAPAQGAAPATATVTATAPPAGTQPAIAPTGRVADAIDRLRQTPSPALRDALTDALANQAWFEIYYNHTAEYGGAPIAGLQQLLKPDDFLLLRLEGWQALESGNDARARAIFTAQQKIDPLCMLGLFQLEDRNSHAKEAAAIGSALLSTPHKGVLGAILYQATKGRGLKPASFPAETAQLSKSLADFPSDWLTVVRAPFRFYTLRVDPIKVGHRMGEPFFVLVTVENISHMDLTISDDGLLKPTLCFSAQIRGANLQNFPGIAVDRIMGRFVLRPSESVNQVVRIDQGLLGVILRSRPEIMVLVGGDVASNADPAQPLKSRAGGYGKNFQRMLMRQPVSLVQDSDRRKFFAALAGGSPQEKILDLELLASYYNQIVNNANAAKMKPFAQQYLDVIDKEREKDMAPGVKVWASYLYSVLTTGDISQKAVGDMMESDSWEIRLLGVVASNAQPPDIRKPIMEKAAAKDAEPIVRSYAAAALELSKAAATQPASIQPATAPAGPTTEPASGPPTRFGPTTRPSAP